MLMPLKLEKIINLTSFFQKIDLLALVSTNSLMIDGRKAFRLEVLLLFSCLCGCMVYIWLVKLLNTFVIPHQVDLYWGSKTVKIVCSLTI